ncbi:hypothetical protein RZS08_00600, partial [Arthrospira platensis SPKY1]|nr:hypothetical protein [Arthrospira platensis SPKY1]
QCFNSEDFSKIVDFIYRGSPIENQELSEIAQGILDTRAMPKDRFFNLGEGGLDNYPSQPQESRVYDPDGNN